MLSCSACRTPLGDARATLLQAEVSGEHYPVCDEGCRRKLEEHPMELLGPRVVLRYRKPCERCTLKIGLWRVADGLRPLRFHLEKAPGLSACPELLLEGEAVPHLREIDDIGPLLEWLEEAWPGLTEDCC